MPPPIERKKQPGLSNSAKGTLITGALAAGAFGIYQLVLFFGDLNAYRESTPAFRYHRLGAIFGGAISLACFRIFFRSRNPKP